MRIGIDARCMVEEAPSGVGFYARELMRALLRRNTTHTFVLFSASYHLPHYPSWLEQSSAELIHRRIPTKILHSLQWLSGHPLLDELIGGCDVLWMPNLHFASWSSHARVVVTVHDLSFVRYPEFFSFKDRLWHRMIRPRQTLLQADVVVADSEHTKFDLESLWHVPTEKIRVVQLGVNPEEWNTSSEDVQRIQQTYHLPPGYILFVGNVEPRKNIGTLLTAYHLLRMRQPHLPDLVVAGKRDQRFQHAAWIHSDIERHVHFLGYVPVRDRPGLYAGANMFVYPSFYEGFGLPPLEAMASGTPVITSPVSSLPEVCGDAALYANPYDAAELARVMEKLWSEPREREILIAKGHQRARQYTWDATATAMLKIFEEGNDVSEANSRNHPNLV